MQVLGSQNGYYIIIIIIIIKISNACPISGKN